MDTDSCVFDGLRLDLAWEPMGYGRPGHTDIELDYNLVIGHRNLVEAMKHVAAPRIIVRETQRRLYSLAAFLMTVCGGCSSPSYPPSSDYDNILLKSAPLLPYHDMYRINRAALGFGPLPERANVVVERQSPEGAKEAGCDVMLHIYPVQADFYEHDISFKKVGHTFKWIGEDEVIYGPRVYTDPNGGRDHEQLGITFPSTTMDGISKPVSYISYNGDDPNWSRYQYLTLSQMHTLLKEWGKDHK